MGAATTQVTKWERGTVTPDRQNLEALADALGVTMDYLVTGSGSRVEQDAALLSIAREKVRELAALLSLLPPEGVAVLGRESVEQAGPPDERRAGETQESAETPEEGHG